MMKKNFAKPLVSIVMPVYNGSRFLSEAIESILNQTYENIELVIVDDKSTDDSREIIKSYQLRYPEVIKSIKLRKNRNGAGNGAVNAVYGSLRGKYYARMDADDVSFPNRIEKQVEFMEKHPDVILLGTQGKIIDGEGRIVGNKNFPCLHKEIYKEYFVFHPVLHPSVIVRRSLVPQKPYFYENRMGVNDDYYTFFRLLRYGKFANLPEALLYYRIHGTNLSLQTPKKKFLNSLRIRIFAVRNFGYKPTFKAVILMAVQTLLIFLLPEKFIVPFYFLIRRINSPLRKVRSAVENLKTARFGNKLAVLSS